MKVESAVKRFMRDYRGELTFTELKNYLENNLHYKLLFFDTTIAKKEIEFLKLKVPKKEKGLTVNVSEGTSKFVFMRPNLSDDDKIHCILHEIGHIVLGHMDISSRELSNERTEQDAELFSYLVISAMKRRETRPQRIAVCVAAVSVVVSVITVVLALIL